MVCELSSRIAHQIIKRDRITTLIAASQQDGTNNMKKNKYEISTKVSNNKMKPNTKHGSTPFNALAYNENIIHFVWFGLYRYAKEVNAVSYNKMCAHCTHRHIDF